MSELRKLIEYEIIHFEDEPASVRGLRDIILDVLCDKYVGLEDVPGYRKYLPANGGVLITVAQHGFQLAYRVVRTEEEFDKLVANVAMPERCVLILDLMRAGGSDLELVGDNLYEKFKEKLFAGTFFLTAYANQVPKAIVDKIGRSNIWPKPPTTTSVVHEIISRLALGK